MLFECYITICTRFFKHLSNKGKQLQLYRQSHTIVTSLYDVIYKADAIVNLSVYPSALLQSDNKIKRNNAT